MSAPEHQTTASSLHSASPPTARTRRPLAAVFGRRSSSPPPLPATSGFYLSPAPDRASNEGRSNSIAQSDVSLAESSSSATASVSIPQPYGRLRKVVSSAQAEVAEYMSGNEQELQEEARSSGPDTRPSLFTRLRQKVSTASLRGHSVLNSAEPLPPLPLLPDSNRPSASPVATSFPPTSIGRKGPLVPRRGKQAMARTKRVKGVSLDSLQPVDDDNEPRTKSFLDHVDFDHLNPEDFIEFDAAPQSLSEEGGATPVPQTQPLPSTGREGEANNWDVPESWAVANEDAMQREDELEDDTGESEVDNEDGRELPSAGEVLFLEEADWVEGQHEVEEDLLEEAAPLRQGEHVAETGEDAPDHDNTMYALRVYRPNGTWHVVACRLTATAYEIRNAMVSRFGLEEHGRVGRHRLFIVERGQEKMLLRNEKPVVMLRRRLIVAGHTKADNLSSQGGRELQHLCRFVLQVSALHGLADAQDGLFGDKEKMVLKNLNLQTIPAALHKHASGITLLSLKGNPITDLPKDFLSATTRLRKLIVSKAALKRVPPALSCCIALEFLDLSYNRITTLELAYGELAGLNRLRVLLLHCNCLKDVPSGLRALDKLTEITLSSNAFRTVPDVLWQLTSLQYLDISHNDVKELSAKVSTLAQLRELYISGNRLDSLPSEIQQLHALEKLDVSRNNLKSVSPVTGMRSLRTFIASHNEIPNVTLQLPKKARVVALDSNPLTRFNPDVKLSGAGTMLTSLDISHSKLSSFQCDLTLLPNLEALVFDDSAIGELPPSIVRLSRLRTLSACNSSLKHLPDAIGEMKRLLRLDVHSNDLTDIPASIWRCPCLFAFNASSNKILSFPAPPSEDAPLTKGLRELYLSDNRLGEEALVSLSCLKALAVLNLSYNCIRDIPDNTLRSHLELQALYLSGNDLMAIRGEDLPKTNMMTKLYLNNNRLQTLPTEIVQYQRLELLDVGYNLLKYNINNFAYDYQWVHNAELKFLNLSGNKRLKIDKPHSNQKSERVPADFRVLRHLELLGLIDVTLAVTYLPEESDICRVRTTVPTLNGMRYDVSDSFGKEGITAFDVVIPKYRGRDGECIFGIFSKERLFTDTFGPSNALTRFLSTHFAGELARELAYTRNDPKLGDVPDAMRRTFLNLNKAYYESVVNPSGGEMPIKSAAPLHEGDPASMRPELQTGACACVAYLVDKALYVANVGNAEAVLGSSGGYETLSTLHTPSDPKETLRIKRGEAQVAPKGLLRAGALVSRAFGFYATFPVINPSPHVRKIALTEDNLFVVIGNAELWSYVKKTAAIDIVRRRHLRRDGMSAAQELRDIAISHGASRNVLVMVIMLCDLFRVPLMRARETSFVDGAIAHSSLSLSTRDRLGSRADAPTGAVALVFTDIRNSTSLWEKHGGRMREAVDVHNKCLRRLLRLCAGYEVKTEGDSFMVSFSSLLAAVRWCLEVQLQLLNEDWPPEILASEEGHEVRDDNDTCIARGLSVRMGVHHGQPFCEVDPTTGRMDYLGPVVNRAARVNNCARGGEIMLSADAASMLCSQLVLQDLQNGKIYEPTTSRDETNFSEALNALDEAPHLEAIRELEPVLLAVGEMKLKGIELPEHLSLLLPRHLLGRHNRLLSSEPVRPRTWPLRTPLSPVASEGRSVAEELVSLTNICRRLEVLEILMSGSLRAENRLQYCESGQGSRSEVLTNVSLDEGDVMNEMQFMSALQAMSRRVERSSVGLRLYHAFGLPEVRRVLIERAGISPEELLQMMRHPMFVRTNVGIAS